MTHHTDHQIRDFLAQVRGIIESIPGLLGKLIMDGFDKLESDIHTLIGDRTALKAEVASLKSDKANLEQELTAAQQQIADGEKKLADFSSLIEAEIAAEAGQDTVAGDTVSGGTDTVPAGEDTVTGHGSDTITAGEGNDMVISAEPAHQG